MLKNRAINLGFSLGYNSHIRSPTNVFRLRSSVSPRELFEQ